MITRRSVVVELEDAFAAARGGHILLLCFPPVQGARHDAAGFLGDVTRSFGGRVMTASVGPDEDSELARTYAVAGTLTLVLLIDGREAARSVGEGGETMMRIMIERHADAGGT